MTDGRHHRFSFAHSLDPRKLPKSNVRAAVGDGTLYTDPVYGEERLSKLTINGIALKGKWEAETEDVGQFDYVLRFIDRVSSNAVSFTFSCPEDRLRAIDALESDRDIPYVDSYMQSVQRQPFFENPIQKRNLAIVGGVVGAVGLVSLLWLNRNKKRR